MALINFSLSFPTSLEPPFAPFAYLEKYVIIFLILNFLIQSYAIVIEHDKRDYIKLCRSKNCYHWLKKC